MISAVVMPKNISSVLPIFNFLIILDLGKWVNTFIFYNFVYLIPVIHLILFEILPSVLISGIASMFKYACFCKTLIRVD